VSVAGRGVTEAGAAPREGEGGNIVAKAWRAGSAFLYFGAILTFGIYSEGSEYYLVLRSTFQRGVKAFGGRGTRKINRQ